MECTVWLILLKALRRAMLTFIKEGLEHAIKLIEVTPSGGKLLDGGDGQHVQTRAVVQ